MAWADSIQKQFDGCDMSVGAGGAVLTSSGQVLNDICIKLQNDADFLKLVAAYGVRTYDQCGYFTGDFTGSLYQAVTDELSTSEVDAINKVLVKHNVTYRF
jgi:hypothetical protein